MPILERAPLKQLMKDCTVKITKPNGELLGTGFFVTPNKLATCLHVLFVGNRPKFKTFKLEGHDDEFPLNANFVLHEDADLLVIDLSKAVGEKCVNLKAGRNLEGQKLWAWTFNTSYPQGSGIVPVIKETAKVKSIEVFRVSLDAVFQGSSGTPVLNAETTDWFGVVYWMKERSDDALIVPAACFKDLFPDLFNENQQHHQETEYWSTARQRSISTKAHHLNIVPSISNKNVVGRTNDLAKLRKGLSEASNPLLMNGIGGIGKTTMAKLYTNNHGDEYDRVLWIEMEETPEQSFATDLGLQSSLGIRPEQGEDYGPVCYRMLHALQNMDGKNLMVLDNAAESIRSIKDRLPAKKHWDILLTSRQVLQQFDIMELGKLDKESAKELFSRHCPKPQPDNALDAFLSKLEYHTLSIELFAKILTAHWEMETVDELSTYLDTNHLDDETLQSVVEVEHARGQTTLYRHLLQAFDLSGIEQVPELMRLLVQMAALPPNVEGYAVKDLMEWFGIETERTTFVNHLNELHRLGWLVQPQTNQFGTHRLIKTIVSHARPASEQDLMPLVETFTQNLSLDQAKDNPVDKFRWITFGQSVLLSVEHLEFNEKATLQNNLALVLKELGDYPRAKVLLEEAVKSNEQNFGPDHPTTAVRYSNLATVLQDLGDYAGAKVLLKKAMKSDEQNFGTDHPATAVRYSNLATVLQVLGDYKGAKALLEKAMKSNEQNFGPDHPTTAASYSNLALVLQDLGDYAGAKSLLEKAIKSDEQNFGPDHPTTAVSYSNLATVLQDLGDYAGAKGLLEKAMMSDEQNFGPEHPTTAVRYSNLALVLKDLEDYQRAKVLLEKAMKAAEQNFGPNHPTTAVSYSNLALTLQALGDDQEAKAFLEKAMKSDEQNFGSNHPTTAGRYWNLATVFMALKAYDKARPLLEKAQQVFLSKLGADHPYSQELKSWMAKLDALEGKKG